MAKIYINRKKHLSAKRRQAQRKYKRQLHDLCIHIDVDDRNISMEMRGFFDQKKSNGVKSRG